MSTAKPPPLDPPVDGLPLAEAGKPGWWTVQLRLGGREVRVHLADPPEGDLSRLRESLRSGRYLRPAVIEDAEYRSLCFGLRYTQSQMSLRDPQELVLTYLRKMLCFRLLQPQPAHIVMIGLGGGSLVKYCHRELPKTRITALEIDPAVIQLSPLFELPEGSARWSLRCVDAVDHFRGQGEPADVVIADGCDERGIAPALCDEAFFASVHDRLRPGGVLVVNLVGALGRSAAVLGALRRAFSGQVAVLKVEVGGNRIALAQREGDWPPRAARLNKRAAMLYQGDEFDFPAWADEIERQAHRGRR
ncbi:MULTISPECIES: hypothetical protein [Hydrocarboniphaga]|uniref:PABS domain-containing protein n=1 Tax=Hydrocarboniphaga effusa AP103 TaxID=1172194 RepID=I7ZK96_9GAMM|nr:MULTISPECIES: hypothetical protein [Hydrocarboniphaga]EIT72187.1 hypothetical protein WQQ_23240 [Hydrocarboniphaga effusa AP103]MDZ4079677.1 hypothetical protein [Hydrocarboniphaga sp.]